MTQNFYHEANNPAEPHMVRMSVVGITGLPENADGVCQNENAEGQGIGHTPCSAVLRVTSLESGKVVGMTPPSTGKKSYPTPFISRKPLGDVSNRGNEIEERNNQKSLGRSLALSWDPPSTLLFVANLPEASDTVSPSCYYELFVYLLVPENSAELGRPREQQNTSLRNMDQIDRKGNDEQSKMKQVPYGSSILCVEPGKLHSSDRRKERHTLPVSVFSFRDKGNGNEGNTPDTEHNDEVTLVSASASASTARVVVDVQIWEVSEGGKEDASTVSSAASSTASSTIPRSLSSSIPRSLGSLLSKKSPPKHETMRKQRAMPMERIVDGFMSTFACGGKCGSKQPSPIDDDDSIDGWTGVRGARKASTADQDTHPLVGSISKRFGRSENDTF